MDTFSLEGLLRIYEFPCDEAQDELELWWPAFSLAEKEKEAEHAGGLLVVEAHNLVTSAGRSQVLTFLGNPSGGVVAFAQYYAVGTGAIYSVSAADTSLATELFRAVPASYSVVGNQVTISTAFTSGQAQGTYTNAGLFGNGATGTAGSGTLMTHLLYSYTKGAVAVTSDYTMSLQ